MSRIFLPFSGRGSHSPGWSALPRWPAIIRPRSTVTCRTRSPPNTETTQHHPAGTVRRKSWFWSSNTRSSARKSRGSTTSGASRTATGCTTLATRVPGKGAKPSNTLKRTSEPGPSRPRNTGTGVHSPCSGSRQMTSGTVTPSAFIKSPAARGESVRTPCRALCRCDCERPARFASCLSEIMPERTSARAISITRATISSMSMASGTIYFRLKYITCNKRFTFGYSFVLVVLELLLFNDMSRIIQIEIG